MSQTLGKRDIGDQGPPLSLVVWMTFAHQSG